MVVEILFNHSLQALAASCNKTTQKNRGRGKSILTSKTLSCCSYRMQWASCLSKHHNLKTEWQLIKWERWTLATILPGLSAELNLSKKAFVIFIVILLTQNPNSAKVHRLGSPDLWITKIPYKAIRRLGNFKVRRPQGGQLSKDLTSATFSLSLSPGAWFERNSIKIFAWYR